MRLNQDIREQETWNVAAMEERTERLCAEALEIWPELTVERAWLAQAELEVKRELAERRDIADIKMTDDAKRLYEALDRKLEAICPDAVVIPEERSISYHDPDFSLEIIPRKYGLGVLIDLEFARSAEISEHLEDATRWTFIVYAEYSGGTYCTVETEEEIMSILPAVRLAHARGAAG